MPRLKTLGLRVATTNAGRVTLGDSWRAEKQGSTARLYNYRWQQESKAFLRAHPLCQCPDCDEGRKRVTLSQVVDHVVPHRGDYDLFWRQSNWAALSKACHDRKTARGE